MRKLLLLFLAGWLVFSISCDNPTESKSNPYEQHAIDWPSLADSPWPMAYSNPQHTCQSQVKANFVGSIQWEVPIGGGVCSGIAIDEEDFIYTGSYYFPQFYKINREGDLIWQRDSITGATNGSPLIDNNGNIYFGSFLGGKSGLHAINESGELKWVFNIEGIDTKGINITKEGNLLFTGNNKLYFVDTLGNLQWIFDQEQLYDWPGCSITPDGNTILSVVGESGICAVSKSGQLLWTNKEFGIIKDSPSIDNDGNCYFLSNISTFQADISTMLFAYTQSGTLLWERVVVTGLWSEEMTGVAISRDGCLIFAAISNADSNSFSYALYCYNLNGDRLWKTDIESDIFNAPPLLTSDGLIFLASALRTGGKVYTFLKDGELVWSSPIEGAVDCSMAQLASGAIVFGTHGLNSYLYLLK